MTAEEHLTAALKAMFTEGVADVRAGREPGELPVYACGIVECLLTLMRRKDTPGLQRMFMTGCELIGGVAKVEGTL